MASSSSNKKSNGKRFKWTSAHDELLLREVLNSEIWLTRAGSAERGDKWKKIADTLNLIECPVFGTNQRSTRERFQFLFEKRKSKNREEERASGISPDITDIDKLLDELIELFETANLEQVNSAKEKANKVALDAEKGLEMRRLSMESMGESAKRKSSDDGKGKEKRARRTASDTFEFLNEKIKIDIEWKKKEFELNERTLEEKEKKREYAEKERSWQREREEKRLTAIENQLERQNEMLAQINVQLQHQNSLIMTLMQHFNATQ
eukprot:gene5672-10912_t